MRTCDQTESRLAVRGIGLWVLLILTGAAVGSGCRSRPDLPAIDLAQVQARWVVREGQAAWTVPDRGAEWVGDLFLATRPGGGGYVLFSKSPFPLVEAQAVEAGWQVRFHLQNKIRAGRGSPPLRVIWFQLLQCFEQAGPVGSWGFSSSPSGEWTLESRRSGESLQGFLRVTSRPREHRVEAGDSLERIATYYGVSPSRLRQLNPGWEAGTLRPGERLALPPVSRAP